MNSQSSRKIAVIGAGVAGITAACLLDGKHEVTLYEKDPGLGGHAQSVRIDNGIEPPFEVDTAFVVFNSVSYPLLTRLLKRFGVQERIRRSEMSFSFSDPSQDFHYAVNRGISGLLPDSRNLFKPFVYLLLPELMRFRRNAAKDLAVRTDLHKLSLEDYLAPYRYSRDFISHFLYPTAMAVWSLPVKRISEFPAVAFLRFLDNHRYLGGRRGNWQTLSGGCQQYVRSFQKQFRGHVQSGSPVFQVSRSKTGAQVFTADGSKAATYDDVILATHADQALRLLSDPSEVESKLLGAWKYQKTPTTLHQDASLMPQNRKLWASWNIRVGEQVTYYLNRVQGLASSQDYFVTLGGPAPKQSKTLARFDYEHPIYDFASCASQSELPGLNGKNNTYFCGSYFGFGFHEDAIRSAAQVAALLDCSIESL